MPDTDLADVAARFASHLHTAGVEAGPDRAARFAESLHLGAPLTNDELYWLGRVTLTGHRDEIAVYDRVFADVFLGIADVAESRGDPNQPNLESVDPGRRRPPSSAPTTDGSGGDARPGRPSGETSPDTDDGRESPVGAPVSRDEHLRDRDFADCTVDELRRLRELVAAMELAPPVRPSRRRRRHATGRSIDRRASLRRARRTGGHPARLVMRRPTERRRRVVLLADVSGSMEAYSRAYLYLLHGAATALAAETFVFSTRLTRLTHRLAATNPDLAMRSAVAEVDDWSGGTRIGAAIRTFNDGWGRRGLARGAVVVIVSDGWESDDPAVLGEQMARLSRLAHRIVWVNPRAKSDRFEPRTGGMTAALPFVDSFTSGHSLDAFDEVLAAISAD
ncbi:vWA domain-containing protein [Ilumatobacter sp.]|uniref:vWA domain-containing protein n=1 Tax=Ilumatobacter sp. TaxID=1967498 RepID=UPI003AF43C98